MKIAIIGYGRMGREVETIAKTLGHEVVCIVDVDNQGDFSSQALASADVAINFSTPDSAWDCIRKCFEAGLPVVSGTTGWLNELMRDEVAEWCDKGCTLVWAPNFSIGMNVTRAANRLLSRLLSPFADYKASVHEVHHVHKKDHPSGSAILLANTIVEYNSRYNVWLEPGPDAMPLGAVPVTHERIGEVNGVHEVVWDSPEDTITLKHEAKSRRGFAHGAVVAADWVLTAPKGHFYTMKDVLDSLWKDELAGVLAEN